jgi:transcriptional repressor NrdR
MNCPSCGFEESKVIDSRSVNDGVRRRRECLNCNFRFTTYERIQTTNLVVIKRSGLREEYSRSKLAKGVHKACEKRPLPDGTIDKLIDDIENEFIQSGKQEIPSSEIGDMVMTKLKELDSIAYIRFAIVYRGYTDLTSLKEEVDAIYEKNDSRNSLVQQLPLLPDNTVVKEKKVKRILKPGRIYV